MDSIGNLEYLDHPPLARSGRLNEVIRGARALPGSILTELSRDEMPALIGALPLASLGSGSVWRGLSVSRFVGGLLVSQLRRCTRCRSKTRQAQCQPRRPGSGRER